MRETFLPFILVGWFFFMSAEPKPGIQANTAVGPFKQKAACEAFQSEMEDYLKAMEAAVKISRCVERRDT
jgi:hypothetical protein